MTERTDPREQPGFKGKRMEERVLLMLGAILDELKALNAPTTRKPKEKTSG